MRRVKASARKPRRQIVAATELTVNPKTEIAVRIAAGAWRKALPGAVALCRRAAKAALEGAASKGAAASGGASEISVILTGDADMRALNLRWRGKDKTTNVLAFPGATPGAAPGAKTASAAPVLVGPNLSGPNLLGPVLLGDVVLALGAVLAEAAQQGKLPGEHLTHLVVHGVLHLLGFDHIRPIDAKAMEAREVAILKTLGIADPYLARKMPKPALRKKA
jgi:probable rRNA maturation factor